MQTLVATEFDATVEDESREKLIYFHSEASGYEESCRSFDKTFAKLAKKLQKIDGLSFFRMNSDKNDVPPRFEMKGWVCGQCRARKGQVRRYQEPQARFHNVHLRLPLGAVAASPRFSLSAMAAKEKRCFTGMPSTRMPFWPFFARSAA